MLGAESIAMESESITNSSIPISAASSKDFGKKKRANRSAKLKQSKRDVRREQWLSQVKSTGYKVQSDGVGGGFCAHEINAHDESNGSKEELDMKPTGEGPEGSILHFGDSDYPSNSPSSHTSSVLGSNVSGTNFTGSSGSHSSSSSSGGSCSGSISGEDEEADDECLDDWEAVADALAATDGKQGLDDPGREQSSDRGSMGPSDSSPGFAPEAQPRPGTELTKPKSEHVEEGQRGPLASRAWKPDDVFRPQSLPNLSKQHSFPMRSSRNYRCGGGAWGCKNVMPAPLSCPICCEDFDPTDANFLPCSCGFRLCLFCHKRILEVDGRCPGCRKQYDHEPIEGEASSDGSSLIFRLPRSSSMMTRS